MKNTFCLSLEFAEKDKELVLGVCYTSDVLGIEEGGAEDKAILKCYFKSKEIADCFLGRIEKSAEFVSIKTGAIKEIIDQDWNAKWRESMEPAQLTDSVWVSPEWLPPVMKKGDHWINIEPKMAFGTGHHETTRLISSAILAIKCDNKSNLNMLDIGTGSGILCIVADYAGYSSCVGVEIDPECLENLNENLGGNTINGSISFCIGTMETIKQNASFDTIVMNMIRTRSESLRDCCLDLLNLDGYFVWSGILCEEKDSVIEQAISNGWKLHCEIIENEWWCGTFRKNN